MCNLHDLALYIVTKSESQKPKGYFDFVFSTL